MHACCMHAQVFLVRVCLVPFWYQALHRTLYQEHLEWTRNSLALRDSCLCNSQPLYTTCDHYWCTCFHIKIIIIWFKCWIKNLINMNVWGAGGHKNNIDNWCWQCLLLECVLSMLSHIQNGCLWWGACSVSGDWCLPLKCWMTQSRWSWHSQWRRTSCGRSSYVVQLSSSQSKQVCACVGGGGIMTRI